MVSQHGQPSARAVQSDFQDADVRYSCFIAFRHRLCEAVCTPELAPSRYVLNVSAILVLSGIVPISATKTDNWMRIISVDEWESSRRISFASDHLEPLGLQVLLQICRHWRYFLLSISDCLPLFKRNIEKSSSSCPSSIHPSELYTFIGEVSRMLLLLVSKGMLIV